MMSADNRIKSNPKRDSPLDLSLPKRYSRIINWIMRSAAEMNVSNVEFVRLLLEREMKRDEIRNHKVG